MSDTPKTAAPTDSAPNTAPAKQNNEVEYNANVPVDLIIPDPKNRDKIDPKKVEEFAASIADVGLLQPVVLRVLKDGKYMLIAGEHRWRAHKQLKLPTIAARIYRNQSELEAAKKKVAENAVRENLTPIEEARRYRELTELGMKQSEIGTMLGKSQPVIANAMRLLELPADVQHFTSQNGMSMAHSVALCRFKTWPKVCLKIAEIAHKNGTAAKELNAGLPFTEELENAKLIKGLDYISDRTDLPKEYQENPDIMAGIPEYEGDEPCLFCLNYETGKTILAVIDALRKKQQAARGSSSNHSQGGKMTEAQKAERKKVIVGNKRRRSETKATLDAAAERLKRTTAIDQSALAVMAQEALRANYSASRFSEAAKLLGISAPKGAVIASWTAVMSLEKLKQIPAVDLIRVCGLAIAMTHGENSLRYASECPKEAQLLAGGKKAAPVLPEKAKATPKTAKKKAPKRTVITHQIRADVKKLVECGKTGGEIAKCLGISLPTTQNIKKALGLVKART